MILVAQAGNKRHANKQVIAFVFIDSPLFKSWQYFYKLDTTLYEFQQFLSTIIIEAGLFGESDAPGHDWGSQGFLFGFEIQMVFHSHTKSGLQGWEVLPFEKEKVRGTLSVSLIHISNAKGYSTRVGE